MSSVVDNYMKPAMPYTQTIELTEILAEAENADTYFPDDPNLWKDFKMVEATCFMQDYPGGLYRFATAYKRIINYYLRK